MRNRRAQSLLELTAIITLVTLAIFFAGPTIIREINAYFKFWDDSIQDSYNDPMKKAPVTTLADCTCSDWQGAIGQRCGVSPCPPMYHLESRLCNPAGCGQAMGWDVERCICDPQCCGQYIDTTVCGLGTGDEGDCPLGQRVTKTTCGTTGADNCRSGGGVAKFSCRVDSDPIEVDGNPSCTPKCLGTYAPDEAVASGSPYLPVVCPGDDEGFPVNSSWVRDSTGIGIPIKMTEGGLVQCNHPPNPDPDQKCEVYCLKGYKPQGLLCRKPCDYVQGVDWPHTGVDDKGELRFYKDGTVRHYKNSTKDAPVYENDGPVTVELPANETMTQDFGGVGGRYPDGRVITLPGNWSLVTDVKVAISGLSRNTVWLKSGADGFGDYTAIEWDDEASDGKVTFNVEITVQTKELDDDPCNPPAQCTNQEGQPVSGSMRFKSSLGHDVFLYCNNGQFVDICAAPDAGFGNYGAGAYPGVNECAGAADGIVNIRGENGDDGYFVEISREGGKLKYARFYAPRWGTQSFTLTPYRKRFTCTSTVPPMPPVFSYTDDTTSNDLVVYCDNGYVTKLYPSHE